MSSSFRNTPRPFRPSVSRRIGKVVSVDANYTITANIAGTSVAGVKYFGSYPPKPGSLVWLDGDGSDILAVGAVAGSGGAVPAGRMEKSTNQDAPIALTRITFATTIFDPWTMYDGVNDQWSIPVKGVYHISAGLVTSANADNNSRTVEIVAAGGIVAATRIWHSSGYQDFLPLSTITRLDRNDKVYLQAAQGSAATITGGIIGANPRTFFSITYLGADA